ncbi:hypothetical protein GCM10025868_35400 [Angustibacter aerolatus]|uniref:ComEC/Rec2-related protein domain-containing protein n=1 Tax=Angustibacter aerolatus TaxID=1162965 RepID=A0ABQ6JJ71_9ACTN|nr:hypothetical protein GCM10025868_35400 [Angustibacter aerolatus]
MALATWLGRQDAISVPLVQDRVPVPLLTTLVSAVVVLTPYAAFPDLEPTLPREHGLRVVRVLGGTALGVVTLLPTLTGVGEPIGPLLRLLLVLTTIGLLSVAAFGDLGWSIPLLAGLAALMSDNGPAQPVTSRLVQAPWWLLLLGWLVAATVLVLRGPRAPTT